MPRSEFDDVTSSGISPVTDLELIYATDSVEEAIAHIQSKAIEPFGLRVLRRTRRSFPWLGERPPLTNRINRS